MYHTVLAGPWGPICTSMSIAIVVHESVCLVNHVPATTDGIGPALPIGPAILSDATFGSN